MATIVKRKAGFCVLIRKQGYPNLSKTFQFKSDAKKWASNIEREMDLGSWMDNREADKMTLAEAIQRYIDKEAPKERGSQSKIARLKMIKRQDFSDFALTKLPPVVLIDWRDDRLEERSPSTVTNDLNAISKVFRIAKTEWGMRGLKNPLEDVRRPGKGQPRDRRLEAGELDKLLEASPKNGVCHHLIPIIILAIETGMRRGEIASLERSAIDWRQNVARLEMTKNGSRRDVPLSPAAMEALKSIPAKLKGPIFGVGGGTITQGFRETVQLTEIQDLRFHDLRHEAASRLFEQGYQLMEVAEILGVMLESSVWLN